MKKALTVLLVCTMLSLLVISVSAQTLTNFIPNSSFENGVEPAVAWGNVELSQGSVAHTGSKSLYVNGTGWGGPSYDVTEILNEQGDGTYNFSAFLNADTEGASVYMFLYITYDNFAEDNHWIVGKKAADDPNIKTNEWTELAISLDMEFTRSILEARLMLINDHGKNYYVDDFTLTKDGVYVSTPVSTPVKTPVDGKNPVTGHVSLVWPLLALAVSGSASALVIKKNKK